MMWPFTRKQSDYDRGVRFGSACMREKMRGRLRPIIEAAVAREREACAKLAENCDALEVADRIRERK